MINECTKSDTSKILNIINDASSRYKGIIPDNCWHEPYMSEQQLIEEFSDGVRMFGYHHNDKLIGVIGIQKVKDVILIRHAYTLTSHQGKGAGSTLLEYMLKKNQVLNKINYLNEAAILPPSTVRTAPVVFFEVAK